MMIIMFFQLYICINHGTKRQEQMPVFLPRRVSYINTGCFSLFNLDNYLQHNSISLLSPPQQRLPGFCCVCLPYGWYQGSFQRTICPQRGSRLPVGGLRRPGPLSQARRGEWLSAERKHRLPRVQLNIYFPNLGFINAVNFPWHHVSNTPCALMTHRSTFYSSDHRCPTKCVDGVTSRTSEFFWLLNLTC